MHNKKLHELKWQAVQLVNERKFEEAKRLLQEVVRRNPRDFEATRSLSKLEKLLTLKSTSQPRHGAPSYSGQQVVGRASRGVRTRGTNPAQVVHSQTAKQVKKIIGAHLGIEEEKVTENASFVEDLGADSLDLVELVMTFEEELGCEIPDDAAVGFQTVGDVIRYIERMSHR